MDHKIFLEKSLDLAVASAKQGSGPFGCLIVKDSEIIAEGHNQVTELNDPTAHAEVQAIRAACKYLGSYQLHGCVVYSSCMPCPQCLGALYWARPEKVYYVNTAEEASAAGFDDSFIYEEMCGAGRGGQFDLERLLVDNDLRAFEAWESNPDKKLY